MSGRREAGRPVGMTAPNRNFRLSTLVTSGSSGPTAAVSPQPRVLLVDDHEAVGQSLAIALRAEGYEADHVAGPTPAAILAAASEAGPDVVVLDLDLGPAGDGRALVGPLTAAGSAVLVLTANTDPVELVSCFEAGAVGVLGKSATLDQILEAVAAVAAGDSPMASHVRDELGAAARRARSEHRRRMAPFELLTPREEDVLIGLGDGLTPAEIAERSFTAVSTVRGHIKAILAKLGVRSQVAAVGKARHAGWLP